MCRVHSWAAVEQTEAWGGEIETPDKIKDVFGYNPLWLGCHVQAIVGGLPLKAWSTAGPGAPYLPHCPQLPDDMRSSLRA